MTKYIALLLCASSVGSCFGAECLVLRPKVHTFGPQIQIQAESQVLTNEQLTNAVLEVILQTTAHLDDLTFRDSIYYELAGLQYQIVQGIIRLNSPRKLDIYAAFDRADDASSLTSLIDCIREAQEVIFAPITETRDDAVRVLWLQNLIVIFEQIVRQVPVETTRDILFEEDGIVNEDAQGATQSSNEGSGSHSTLEIKLSDEMQQLFNMLAFLLISSVNEKLTAELIEHMENHIPKPLETIVIPQEDEINGDIVFEDPEETNEYNVEKTKFWNLIAGMIAPQEAQGVIGLISKLGGGVKNAFVSSKNTITTLLLTRYIFKQVRHILIDPWDDQGRIQVETLRGRIDEFKEKFGQIYDDLGDDVKKYVEHVGRFEHNVQEFLGRVDSKVDAEYEKIEALERELSELIEEYHRVTAEAASVNDQLTHHPNVAAYLQASAATYGFLNPGHEVTLIRPTDEDLAFPEKRKRRRKKKKRRRRRHHHKMNDGEDEIN